MVMSVKIYFRLFLSKRILYWIVFRLLIKLMRILCQENLLVRLEKPEKIALKTVSGNLRIARQQLRLLLKATNFHLIMTVECAGNSYDMRDVRNECVLILS